MNKSKTKVVRQAGTIWKAYDDYSNGWKLESRQIEYTEKMVYFKKGENFSGFVTQVSRENIDSTCGWTPEEARQKAIARLERELVAAEERVHKLKADLETVKALPAPEVTGWTEG